MNAPWIRSLSLALGMVLVLTSFSMGQNPEGKPDRIGRFSNPREITFVGNEQISAKAIHSALSESSNFILASHPLAPFDPYLKDLQWWLHQGYLASGFPNPKVEVAWDDTKKTIVAKIEEGPRYRQGNIKVRGAKIVDAETIRTGLTYIEMAKRKKPDREGVILGSLIKKKQLPTDQLKEYVDQVFPGLLDLAAAEQGEPDPLNLLIEAFGVVADENPGFWEEGDWANYVPVIMTRGKMKVFSLYAKEGLIFVDYEVRMELSKETGLVDLIVDIKDEGGPSILGKIHIKGHEENTRDEILKYLGIEEGMALKGDSFAKIERKLYESARFMGWKLVGKRPKPGEPQVDLLLVLKEMRNTPPLHEPLTREQKALLKFVEWMNYKSGAESDLAITLTDTRSKNEHITLFIHEKRMGLSVSTKSHHVRALGEWGEALSLAAWDDAGSAFHASTKVGDNLINSLVELYVSTPENPYAKIGSVSFGAVLGNRSMAPLAIALDPAAGLHMCSSEMGMVCQFEDGQMVLRHSHATLCFDETSGRLISLTIHDSKMGPLSSLQGNRIQITPGNEGIEELRQDIGQISRKAGNWADGKSAFALTAMSLAYLGEMAAHEQIEELSLTELSSDAAKRVSKWEPVALALSKIVAIGEDGDVDEEIPAEMDFFLPYFPEKLGGNPNGALAFFDMMKVRRVFTDHLKYGSWQKQLLRETFFFLSGKYDYLKESMASLAKEESVGPIGNALCAELVKKVGLPMYMTFLKKAQKELNAKGFAKDWSAFFSGGPEETGVNESLIKLLEGLSEEDLKALAPETNAELRKSLGALTTLSQKSDRETKVSDFQPAMNGIWNHWLEPRVKVSIEAGLEAYFERYDPELVAAAVDNYPIARPFIPLMEPLQKGPLKGAFPNLALLWHIQPEGADEHDTALAKCISTALFALQAYRVAGLPKEPYVHQLSEKLAVALGKDGWQQLEAMGFDKEALHIWVSAMIAADIYAGQVMRKRGITREEAKAWYDAHHKILQVPDLKKAHLHVIRLQVREDMEKQHKILDGIRKDVLKAEGMEKKVETFTAAAKAIDPSKNSDFGPTYPLKTFHRDMAPKVMDLPSESLSDIIDVEIHGSRFLYLILVADKWVVDPPQPFMKMAPLVTVFLNLEKERERLKSNAAIHVIEAPGPDAGAEDAQAKGFMYNVALLMTKFYGISSADVTPAPKEKEPEHYPANLEGSLEGHAKGNSTSTYLLGSYAEEGIGKENGMEAAMRFYHQAAEAGNIKAMLRLSEIHRDGIGVDKSPEDSAKWKNKALESITKQN